MPAKAGSNPQPLHIDVEAAKASEFGQILVNGTFTFALMIGLSVGDTTLGTLIDNLGDDKLLMPKPVFIGDPLRAETDLTELKASKSRPGAGVVTFSHRLINQGDEIVCQRLRMTLIKRKQRIKLRQFLASPKALTLGDSQNQSRQCD